MTKLEILKHQRNAVQQAIFAIGKLNDLGLTCSYDGDELEKARVANKSAFYQLGEQIKKLESKNNMSAA
jgi:hypothetical protein|tara:strand:- start:122 stop:328 length:207 start_codon:yes stop_codon:yes gene_type:complete